MVLTRYVDGRGVIDDGHPSPPPSIPTPTPICILDCNRRHGLHRRRHRLVLL